MLAEAEFNRFYLRALCARAKQDGIGRMKIYRADSAGNENAVGAEDGDNADPSARADEPNDLA